MGTFEALYGMMSGGVVPGGIDLMIGSAAANPIMRSMPPGTTPPLIIPYSASNVPILQLGLSSSTLDEQQIYDLGTNFLRTGLATVQGAQVPLPVGGKVREVE